MKLYYRDGVAYKKVDRSQARRLFLQGHKIFLMPSKISFDSAWIAPAEIDMESELSLDGAVNAFNYYNCNSETGCCAYYVEVKERF